MKSILVPLFAASLMTIATGQSNAPPVLWSMTGAEIDAHALTNYVVRGPFDFGPADAFTVNGLDDWSESGSTFREGYLGWYEAAGLLIGSAAGNELNLTGMVYGEMQTNAVNIFKGSDAKAGYIAAYFRGPGNGIRPHFSIRGTVSYSFLAVSRQSYIGATAYGGGAQIFGDGIGGDVSYSFEQHLNVDNSDYCWGPVQFSQYPGVEYWGRNDAFTMNPGCEVWMGAYFPVGYAFASSNADLHLEAWLEEGVPPVASIEVEGLDQGAVMPAQIKSTEMRSLAYDPDNPGTERGRGIIYYDWTIETDMGNRIHLHGQDVTFPWYKEGTYAVSLKVVDDEGMSKTTSTTVVVRGPVPRVRRINKYQEGRFFFVIKYEVSPEGNYGTYDQLREHTKIIEDLCFYGLPDPGHPGSILQPKPWIPPPDHFSKRAFLDMWPFWNQLPDPYFGDTHGPWDGPYLDYVHLTKGMFVTSQVYRYWAPWLRLNAPDDQASWPPVAGEANHMIIRSVYPTASGWKHKIYKSPDERIDSIP